MIKVQTTALPAVSLLHERIAETDFIDCYSTSSHLSAREAAEIMLNFPGWVRLLMQLRNLMTAPLGLSAGGPADAQRIGAFPIETETEHELIAGFDDSHLNFRVSVLACDGDLFLATWVHTHNLVGRVYLRAIMPFHVVIVRNALYRAAQVNEPTDKGSGTTRSPSGFEK